MKKYLSVYALAARASFLKVLAITLVAAILCGVLLWFAPAEFIDRVYDGYGAWQDIPSGRMSADLMVQKSFCPIPELLGIAAVIIILSRIGTGRAAQPGYTVLRLSITSKAVTFIWTIYNFIMILFYRAVMVLTIYGVIGYRLRDAGPQALLLASYGNAFLHNLLPLRDIPAWILLFTLSFFAAIGCALRSAGYWRETVKSSGVYYSSIAMTAACSNLQMGSIFSIVLAICMMITICVAIHWVFGENENEVYE